MSKSEEDWYENRPEIERYQKKIEYDHKEFGKKLRALSEKLEKIQKKLKKAPITDSPVIKAHETPPPRQVRPNKEIIELYNDLHDQFVDQTNSAKNEGKDLTKFFDYNNEWDGFIKSYSENNKNHEILAFHLHLKSLSLSNYINDYIDEAWTQFVFTGNIRALDAYIHFGGEVNEIVRQAIVQSRENKTFPKDYERYRIYLKFADLMNEKVPGTGKRKYSRTKACEELAKQIFGNNENLSTNARKIANHINITEENFATNFPKQKL